MYISTSVQSIYNISSPERLWRHIGDVDGALVVLGEACLEEGAEVGAARTEDTLVGRHGDLERRVREERRKKRGGKSNREEGVPCVRR